MAVDDQTEEALGWAAEGAKYAQEYTPKDITLKDAATFVAEATPIIGDAMAAKEVYDELQKDDPNYYLAGALGGAAVIGLVPGLGDAAANAIRAGARKVVDIGKRIEVDPNTIGSLGGNIKLKPPVEEATPQLSNIEYQKKMAEFDKTETADDWQNTVSAYVTESRDVNPTVRTPELEDSTKDLIDGKITREQHLQNVDKYKPVEAWDALPREPSSKATVFSLKPDQREKGKFILPDKAVKNLNVEKSALKVGDKFNGRLDIPAYNRFDTWIVAGTSTAEKGVTHYAKAIHYKGVDDKPVRFLASTKKSEKIGTGEEGKTGYATVSGEIKDLDVEAIRDKAAKLLEDPEWTQVGFDPRRQGGFYVRSGENKHIPVREASEVIQIGPLVLAKNAKLDMEYTGYNEGGLAMDDQMEMVFKSSRGYALGGAVEEVDPVSGNEVPTGSLPKEVRDDIPARLSEGEYVVPADVVRYYGVKFFEDLRSQAKMGFDTMEANGRIGGEPMGMEIVEPEDMKFDMSELEVVDDGVMGFNEGGFVDEGGALGLGSEGIGLSSGEASAGIETRAYTNDAGDIIYIMFIGNTPMMAIPDGYYPLEEAKKEEPKEEPKPKARDRGPSTPVVAPEPIDYKSLTLQELTDMVDDQQSVTGDVAAGIFGVVNPLLGVAVKGAMWHQAQQIENEIKRRTTMEGITEEDLASYTNLLEIMEKDKPSLIERIFGKKDKPVVDPDAVDAAVKEAMEAPEYSAEGWVDPDLATQDYPPIPRETGPNAAEAAEIAAANKSAAEAYEAAGTQPFLPFEADATAPTTDYSNPKLSNEIQDTMGITSAVFPAQPRTSISRDTTKSPSETMTMPTAETPVVIPEPVDPDAFRKREQKTGVGGRNIGGR